MEIIIAIALLCQTSTGRDALWEHRAVDADQLECQKYYVECTEKNKGKISTCIKERKVKE